MPGQKTLVELFRARSGGGLASKSPTINEGASTSGGSSSSGASGGSSESPSQLLTEEVELNLPKPQNQSLSDAGKLSKYHDVSTTLSAATTSSSSSTSTASSNPCECRCCTNCSVPYHPLAVDSYL